jgi:Ca2+-dependent lipid-binding protein
VFLLQTREGRPQRSKVVKNNANPQYNEEFFLLVDDLEHQKLSIKVRSTVPAQTRCPGRVWGSRVTHLHIDSTMSILGVKGFGH